MEFQKVIRNGYAYMMLDDDPCLEIIYAATGATKAQEVEVVQSLWSGYGKIARYELSGCEQASVIVKHISWKVDSEHPRGWNTDLSHKRKLKSYEVESHWYKEWSAECDASCRIPQCFAVAEFDAGIVIVMEDLDAAGFPKRLSCAGFEDMQAPLRWLAHFHAKFLQKETDGLWPVGTYWHLETRPDELEVMSDLDLKEAAEKIDSLLSNCRYKTFVHGDAKLANFCFSPDGKDVAAVDFQYIGGGCGMKDVAYFIGSCLREEDCEKYESRLLDYYFSELKIAVEEGGEFKDWQNLETSWRALFPIAWTDFHRFLKGWSPGHWKINSYSERMAQAVLARLNNIEGSNG